MVTSLRCARSVLLPRSVTSGSLEAFTSADPTSDTTGASAALSDSASACARWSKWNLHRK